MKTEWEKKEKIRFFLMNFWYMSNSNKNEIGKNSGKFEEIILIFDHFWCFNMEKLRKKIWKENEKS